MEGHLKTLGLLNYHPVAEIMARPVIVINEISRVSSVFEVLKATEHNGFPVLNIDGHLRGLILRKTLCSLLKYKAFSFPTTAGTPGSTNAGGATLHLAPASTVFFDTIERNYPRYANIDDIQLLPSELVGWFRSYLISSSYTPCSFYDYRPMFFLNMLWFTGCMDRCSTVHGYSALYHPRKLQRSTMLSVCAYSHSSSMLNNK